MKIARQDQLLARHLLNGCLVAGVLDEERVRLVAREVAMRKPRRALPLLTHFGRLVRREVTRRSVLVESAVPIGPAQRERLRANLEAQRGPGLRLAFAETPELIGGMRVRVGDDVLDGSVQARLRQLYDQF